MSYNSPPQRKRNIKSSQKVLLCDSSNYKLVSSSESFLLVLKVFVCTKAFIRPFSLGASVVLFTVFFTIT